MSSPPTAPLEVEHRPGRPPVVLADPADEPLRWTAEHRASLRALVVDQGSVLVRGLGLRDAAELAAVADRLGNGPVTERERFAPRRTYAEGVYSSSTWPPNQPMCMHHELSYALEFPGLMLFACLGEPTSGGATGLADAAAVLDALPPGLVDRFEREGWLLARSYHDDLGASVAEAFGTDDRAAVERYCHAHAIGFRWEPDGGLRTVQRRGAVVRHPVTGRRCWFNQIAFLSEWTMDAEVREFLVDVYGPDGLPFTTRFGSGEPVGEDVVALLNEVYEAATVREPWRRGDLLLVDNIATAHSREPYEGPREVLVAMTDPVRRTDRPSVVEEVPR